MIDERGGLTRDRVQASNDILENTSLTNFPRWNHEEAMTPEKVMSMHVKVQQPANNDGVDS